MLADTSQLGREADMCTDLCTRRGGSGYDGGDVARQA